MPARKSRRGAKKASPRRRSSEPPLPPPPPPSGGSSMYIWGGVALIIIIAIAALAYSGKAGSVSDAQNRVKDYFGFGGTSAPGSTSKAWGYVSDASRRAQGLSRAEQAGLAIGVLILLGIIVYMGFAFKYPKYRPSMDAMKGRFGGGRGSPYDNIDV